MPITDEAETAPRVSTGVAGLDEILGGGLIPGRAYLLRGGPGTGKTTLGLQFLQAAAERGESSLFLTLEESEKKIRQNARYLGLDLSQITFLDLSPTRDFFTTTQSYDIFSPAEVEREPLTEKIIQQVERQKPTRIYLEAMTQFRYLTTDSFQFHKQVIAFLTFLSNEGATVLFSSEGSALLPDDDLQFVSDGVIQLENTRKHRSIEVTKFRGSDFRGGPHTVRLEKHGMEVFPKLESDDYGRPFHPETIRSGVPELDELLEGGMTRGMVTLITGPSGVGKTTVGVQFMKELAGRGEHSVIYLFEEWRESFVHRCEAIGIPVKAMIDRGTLSVVQIEPLRYSSDEFNRMVRREVEERDAKIVMIDSTSGYQLCIRSDDLIQHIAALTRYIKNMGVTALLVNETESISGGEFRVSEAGVSFLADNILFLRYLEVNGELRKAIGVLKKRMSNFQKTLRELDITPYGLKVGRPLTDLRGILIGTPVLVNDTGGKREPIANRVSAETNNHH